jgi:phosphoribosylamine--glycine ligase
LKILIVGGGGREHALAWKVAQSPRTTQVYVAPGNAGTAAEAKTENVAIGAEDIPALLAFAKSEQIDLTIVGPEAPLVMGIVDQFEAAGLKCFGPSQAGAQLEGSKSFSKDFLARHQIPTAAYRVFDASEPACAYVRERGAPLVVKANGLAAGKGVFIAGTEAEAIAAIGEIVDQGRFGDAGASLVVEDFLEGEEASFIVVSDGTATVAMASSQDHKARDDGDRGPNTGGMGAYSPAPVVDAAMHERIMRTVIEPTIAGMAADGIPYRGFLYAGLMITADGTPQVLEFNCRFGDPETQPILMRLRSDLVDICLAALDGGLSELEPDWDPRAALGVVLAAGGYPASYAKGAPISGLAAVAEQLGSVAKVFHAGTALNEGEVVTAGGRVLCVCALGDRVTDAQAIAYQGVNEISWEQMYYRTDVGYRALAREAGE